MKKKVIHFKRKPNRWKQNIISWVKRNEIDKILFCILVAIFILFCFAYMVQTNPY